MNAKKEKKSCSRKGIQKVAEQGQRKMVMLAFVEGGKKTGWGRAAQHKNRAALM